MSAQELFPAPYCERGDGFAVQAVTHWLRTAPGRVMFGLKAGSLPVALPDRPAAVSHRGDETKTDGHVTAIDDVSSAWLREHDDVTDRYIAALRAVLTNPRLRLDGEATHAIFTGSIELFAGPRMDRVELYLDDEDGSYERAIDLLRNAPTDTRTAFAMPPEPGTAAFEDPSFLAGEQAWIDGTRILIEFVPDEGGRPDTAAIDRSALADAIERAWGSMIAVSERIRQGLAHVA